VSNLFPVQNNGYPQTTKNLTKSEQKVNGDQFRNPKEVIIRKQSSKSLL